MLYFGIACGYIVTAEKDGGITLNARIAAAIDANGANGCTMALINQANAAPELLEALEALMEYQRNGTPVHPGALIWEDVVLPAIAKAKGE